VPAPADKSPDLPLPFRLGHYELRERIGAGGMGTVYRAWHERLKRVVAIKLLPKDRMSDAQAVARFEREMEAVGAVDHPNIVRAMHADEEAGTPYLVVEYVDGLNLTELVTRLGPLRMEDACELIRQAAAGLQHAHAHGLVHRDIKPSNIMVAVEGQTAGFSEKPAVSRAIVKILDLGFGAAADQQPRRRPAAAICRPGWLRRPKWSRASRPAPAPSSSTPKESASPESDTAQVRNPVSRSHRVSLPRFDLLLPSPRYSGVRGQGWAAQN